MLHRRGRSDGAGPFVFEPSVFMVTTVPWDLEHQIMS